jgi:hypothetical protein
MARPHRSTSAGPNMPRESSHPLMEHVHGVLASSGLMGFYLHECHGRNIVEALADQNEWALGGLALLCLFTTLYGCSVVTFLWKQWRR